MTFKNTVFYVEDEKFYISRYVLIAIFRLLIGSQRPDGWPDEMLLNRFERCIPFYPKEKAGIFFPVFERAASVPIENWVLTNTPLPRLETIYPQLPISEVNPDFDEVDDNNDSTLEVSAPIPFFAETKIDAPCCWKQRPKFRFSDFNILPGSILTYKRDPSITVITSDEKTGVISDDYESGTSWTEITRRISGFSQVAPVDYWLYNGVLLRKIYDKKHGSRRLKNSKKSGSSRKKRAKKSTSSKKSKARPPIIKRSLDFSLSAPVNNTSLEQQPLSSE